MENGDKIKIHERVTTLEADNKYTKETVSYIKKRVENHLPHQIEEVKKEVSDLRESIVDFMLSNKKQYISILVSIILLLIAAIVGLIKFI